VIEPYLLGMSSNGIKIETQHPWCAQSIAQPRLVRWQALTGTLLALSRDQPTNYLDVLGFDLDDVGQAASLMAAEAVEEAV
jgi:hypothetical protein